MKKILIFCMVLSLIFLISCQSQNKDEINNENGNTISGTNEDNNEDKNQDNNVDTQNTSKISEYQLQKPEKGETIAIIKTNLGDIKVRFFPEETPLTYENFITHAKDGYYDNVTFHRVIEDFMIQGGDPDGNGTGGESIWGKPFKDEFSNKLYNIRGALSMANSSQNRGSIYSSNGSQFFIVQKKTFEEEQYLKDLQYDEGVINNYKNLGGTCWLDLAHTVFGQVFEGMDVVDKIAGVETSGSSNSPKEPVVINTIEITEYE